METHVALPGSCSPREEAGSAAGAGVGSTSPRSRPKGQGCQKKTWMINQSKDYFWVVFLGNIAKQDPDQYFFLTNTYQIEFFFNKEINMV